MKVFYSTISLLLLVLLLAITRQEIRYFDLRRDVAFDRQNAFHSSSVLHVVTMLDLNTDQELIAAVGAFVKTAESVGGEVVYAGKVAANALVSKQLPQRNWDAAVLVQYESQDEYQRVSLTPEYRTMRGRFADSYAIGFNRSPWLNLALPVALMGMRYRDIVMGQPSPYPFVAFKNTTTSPNAFSERSVKISQGLLANREYGKDALVVVNFIKKGSKAEQDANSGYGRAMLSLMAEIGNGPIHVGPAVELEGDADFDQIVIVYYPGVQYFSDLITSEFFVGIVGGKQLGDSLSTPTVPLLPHL